MKVQETSYLDIRFDLLFSIYVVFAIAAILRYLWLGWRALLGKDPGAYDPTNAGSGV
jgi:C4-dicarboxylate transporter DctQ subunit